MFASHVKVNNYIHAFYQLINTQLYHKENFEQFT